MKRGSTLLLRLAIVTLGMAILALCVALFPAIYTDWARAYPDVAYLKYPILLGLSITALAFYAALWQGMKLLSYIDTNRAFSELSVKALHNIMYPAFIISGLYALALPLFYRVAQSLDAPGFMVIGSVFAGAPFVAAVFAAVLKKLLQNAIDMKKENDLTV